MPNDNETWETAPVLPGRRCRKAVWHWLWQNLVDVARLEDACNRKNPEPRTR